MVFVITEACVDVKDRSCMQQCPVDCIYEGERSLYIHPDECIDCGACEPVCPVEAVYHEEELPDALSAALDSNRAFFAEILPGRSEPLGSPKGAKKVGPIGGGDTPFVIALSAKD